MARFGQRYIVALDAASADAAAAVGGLHPSAGGAGAASPVEVDAIGRGRHQDIVVGDSVHCSVAADIHVIEAIEPRRNLLYRADASRTKPLAANVDQVAIVFAAQPPSQPEFLWRALLAARAAGIEALAILNKIDLQGPEAQASEAALGEVERLGARALRLSARTDADTARERLAGQCRGLVTLFVGQSGMGKSSLLNLLIDSNLRIGALSRGGTHGRQTTTATRWFGYGADGAVIDSPGFHEFGLEHLDSQHLTQWLPDFAAVGGHCRFADCRHAEEPDCAIRAALDRGAIRPERYAFYRKLLAQEPGTTVSKVWR